MRNYILGWNTTVLHGNHGTVHRENLSGSQKTSTLYCGGVKLQKLGENRKVHAGFDVNLHQTAWAFFI